MKQFEIIVILLMIAFGGVFLFVFIQHEGDIINNLLPELIGFTMEGILFVILFTWIQRHEEKKSQEKK